MYSFLNVLLALPKRNFFVNIQNTSNNIKILTEQQQRLTTTNIFFTVYNFYSDKIYCHLILRKRRNAKKLKRKIFK